MNSCKPTLLFDQDQFCIAQCQHCQRIGLTFKNLLLGFSHNEFMELCRHVNQVSFDQCSTLMADGQSHLIINTCHPDIQFSLSRLEFDLFQAGLSKALRLLGLYNLLKIQSN